MGQIKTGPSIKLKFLTGSSVPPLQATPVNVEEYPLLDEVFKEHLWHLLTTEVVLCFLPTRYPKV